MLAQTFRFFLLLLVLTAGSLALCAQESEDFVVVKEVKIIGNKSTNEKVILRELPFKIYDTIQNSNLKKTQELLESNLLNTSLFNFVTVAPVYFDDKNIAIFITVEERWYWWPIPIFEIQETNFNTWWLDKNFDRANYGMFFSKENFRGRKERLSFLFQDGYTEKVGVNYDVPYINRRKTTGLNVMFYYSRNREISYDVKDNLRAFYKSNSEYVRKEIKSSIGYELRPKIFNKHNFNIDYSDISISDSVLALNDDYLLKNNDEMQYLSFRYFFKRDRRDVKNYPTKGSYIDFKLFQHGFGLISDLNTLYLTSHLKRFWQIAPKFYFASSVKTKFTVKDSPYYLLNGFAFGNDLVRGYELYIVNGEHYGLTKLQLRYSLLKNKVFKVDAIRFDNFNKVPLDIYLGAYFDAGYTSLKNDVQANSLANTALFGGGFSMDFVSYYDLVLRVEYSINKMNEKGLFLHFIAPI